MSTTDLAAAVARALTEERAANQTAVGTGVMSRHDYRERSAALDLLEGRLTRLLERTAGFAAGDRVCHANDSAANVGTVAAVEPATASDPPLVTVEWDDGYSFSYAADVLKRAADQFTAQTGERFELANEDGTYALDVVALEPTPGYVGPDFVLIVGSADPDVIYTAGVQVSRLTRKQ